MRWPAWWQWEIEITGHAKKRMALRDFTEVELRAMLQAASAFRPNVVAGRYLIATRFRRRPWEVIVEPITDEQVLLIITAYPRSLK